MAYGKIHATFFDSSINETEPTIRLVFIAMIVLSDREGRMDLTVEALARRVNLDVATVRTAIEVLSSPDPGSRTPDHDGRRVVPLVEGRAWGWRVVNKEAYRSAEDLDAARADARERKRRQREREASSSKSSRRDTDSSFTEDSSNTNTKDTPGVTRHTESRAVTSRHKVSREKCDSIFALCWALVPRKEGRKDARKHFDAELKRVVETCETPFEVDAAVDQFAKELETAVSNYAAKVATERITPRYIKLGSTLFFNYLDYVSIRPLAAHRVDRPEGLKGVAL